ncbi:hypothetical protein EOD39_12496 [Acipenser ruthenus]|uniref:Uncharacterized protein n=1 Tax=Acipenser ruthenus TaxID=7906 RepID=A0A662YRV9_ACIRT|nr:hypothetical protein EOD39_12496 [Acipenser ruthenus]
MEIRTKRQQLQGAAQEQDQRNKAFKLRYGECSQYERTEIWKMDGSGVEGIPISHSSSDLQVLTAKKAARMVVGWRGGEEVGQNRAGISDRRPRQTGLSQRAVQIQKGRVYKTLAVSVTQNKRAPRLPPPAPPVLLCAPPQTTEPDLLSAASSQQTQPQQQHLHFKLEIDEQDHIRSVGSEPANGTLVLLKNVTFLWDPRRCKLFFRRLPCVLEVWSRGEWNSNGVTQTDRDPRGNESRVKRCAQGRKEELQGNAHFELCTYFALGDTDRHIWFHFSL